MIRILIADADLANRERYRRLLESQASWQVCGIASTGQEALDLARDLSPQVAIIDLALPGMNGLEVVRQLRRTCPQTEIAVVTAHETDDLVRDLLVAGAQACLVERAAADHLVAAVEALAQHRAYLTPTVMDAVLEVYLAHGGGSKAATRPFLLLTAREREILQLLAEGRSNSAIAQLLSISVKTVETHRGTLMKKLGVSSLAELVRYAIRNRVTDDT